MRTVSRKRRRLEQEGILKYYTAVELQGDGTSRYTTRHMIIIKFTLGVTRSQIVEEIRSEPNVANVFSELIRDSFIAETDGQVALVMIVEGESDSDRRRQPAGEDHPLAAEEPRQGLDRRAAHHSPARHHPPGAQLPADGQHERRRARRRLA